MPIPTNVGLPDDILKAIGHVASIWTRLEYTIDRVVREALDRYDHPAKDTSLMMPFARRMDLFDEMAPSFAIEGEDLALAVEFSSEARRLQKRRDFIVHGSVANSAQIRQDEPIYWFRRVRWDSPARILEKRPMTVAQVEAIALEISNLFAIAGLFEILIEV